MCTSLMNRSLHLPSGWEKSSPSCVHAFWCISTLLCTHTQVLLSNGDLAAVEPPWWDAMLASTIMVWFKGYGPLLAEPLSPTHCENFAQRTSVVCAAWTAQGKPMCSTWNVPQSQPVCCALKSHGMLKDFQSHFWHFDHWMPLDHRKPLEGFSGQHTFILS